MVTDNPIILIDEETLTYYCHGCCTITQAINHYCEGQIDRIVEAAEKAYTDNVIYPKN